MKIYLATDHAGFELKENIKDFLSKQGYSFEDLGAHSYAPQDDYPDFIGLAGQKVSQDPENILAIIFGGSGQGEAMVANRFKNVRATVYYGGPKDIIKLSREHNNANILSIGARFVSPGKTKKIIKLWLDTPFSNNPRHVRRIKKIDQVN